MEAAHHIAAERVVRVPGDGNCLFHALTVAMQQAQSTAQSAHIDGAVSVLGPDARYDTLRQAAARYLATHGSTEVTPGLTFDAWAQAEMPGLPDEGAAQAYAQRFAARPATHAGPLELAAIAALADVDIIVRRASLTGTGLVDAERIASPTKAPLALVRVLYNDVARHYDAIVWDG